ncbi:hypothetical protein PAPYR_6616 [Paratrimastix pyriformis]|uniref:CUE domain-containing protein n=1 Tax=Paratrimastix pyriformis TaxID=342808 RepID=A0ABQ8UIP9_9EUKA|nr:hypothetical protein PAPYR_6616 [Paratrimastix pyriformis]
MEHIDAVAAATDDQDLQSFIDQIKGMFPTLTDSVIKQVLLTTPDLDAAISRFVALSSSKDAPASTSVGPATAAHAAATSKEADEEEGEDKAGDDDADDDAKSAEIRKTLSDVVALMTKMFPSVDSDLIISVLAETSWDIDQTVEKLQEISGGPPADFTPDSSATSSAPAPASTSTPGSAGDDLTSFLTHRTSQPAAAATSTSVTATSTIAEESPLEEALAQLSMQPPADRDMSRQPPRKPRLDPARAVAFADLFAKAESPEDDMEGRSIMRILQWLRARDFMRSSRADGVGTSIGAIFTSIKVYRVQLHTAELALARSPAGEFKIESELPHLEMSTVVALARAGRNEEAGRGDVRQAPVVWDGAAQPAKCIPNGVTVPYLNDYADQLAFFTAWHPLGAITRSFRLAMIDLVATEFRLVAMAGALLAREALANQGGAGAAPTPATSATDAAPTPAPATTGASSTSATSVTDVAPTPAPATTGASSTSATSVTDVAPTPAPATTGASSTSATSVTDVAPTPAPATSPLRPALEATQRWLFHGVVVELPADDQQARNLLLQHQHATQALLESTHDDLSDRLLLPLLTGIDYMGRLYLGRALSCLDRDPSTPVACVLPRSLVSDTPCSAGSEETELLCDLVNRMGWGPMVRVVGGPAPAEAAASAVEGLRTLSPNFGDRTPRQLRLRPLIRECTWLSPDAHRVLAAYFGCYPLRRTGASGFPPEAFRLRRASDGRLHVHRLLFPWPAAPAASDKHTDDFGSPRPEFLQRCAWGGPVADPSPDAYRLAYRTQAVPHCAELLAHWARRAGLAGVQDALSFGALLTLAEEQRALIHACGVHMRAVPALLGHLLTAAASGSAPDPCMPTFPTHARLGAARMFVVWKERMMIYSSRSYVMLGLPGPRRGTLIVHNDTLISLRPWHIDGSRGS